MPTPTEAQLKVTAYLEKMPPFAQAICLKLRTLILQADPTIKETWKWSAPVYEKNNMICSYRAFKQHVRLSFFHKADMEEAKMVKEGSKDDPAQVAKDGYEALMAGELEVISGLKSKAIVAASKLMPDSMVAATMHNQAKPSEESNS